MINEIIDGICMMLNDEFGDTYEIYTESIEQNLVEPCFSVLCLNPSSEQVVGNRYFISNQFCIHYFPSTSEKNNECISVMERLMDCLEFIAIGDDMCKGTSMHGEIVDGVLNFFVNYNMYVYKQKEKETEMEAVSIDTQAN